ncbi:NAD-dependent epimerase/dehydratase family protein [Pyxidicoccus sp. MSG2]|uniref:NAD-dependent epimerase/dehydratase family protein n=1 Tax=Pyxidicoccus sp. MSG2 TaxID=2996790 RepID=UPI0022716074|nr:NAD-dependent epimerase/dehydratase family protein [Pyxidicoccus sp. MSG2]MCY1021447.1 NAD-dependent epimerase/dehydratase family protein [Pyxidicoccus sp. MSG2]
MKVLVTGGTGFVGGGAIRALRQRGHEVLTLARESRAARELAASGVRVVHGDLSADHVPAAREVDAIVHCAMAPFKGLRVSRAEQRRIAELDLDWSLRLLRAGAGAASTFVFSSGIWVYGDTGESFADESSTPRPFRIVESKVATEQKVAEEARRLGYRSVIVLRIGTVYGPTGSFEKFFLQPMRAGKRVRWFGSGLQHTSLVHVDDVGQAYALAVEKNEYATYNIVDDEPVPMRTYMGYLAEQLGAPAPGGLPAWLASLVTGALGEPLTHGQKVSNAKARRELGWRPAFPTYREGLRHLATPATPVLAPAAPA